jgi:molybdenum cofactor synthesis domain-containing protein
MSDSSMADSVAKAADGVVTAAVLVIGDEILSGRTKDKNIGYIAEYLTTIGIDLKEVRVVPDEEAEIVAALNAMRVRYTYVFTTGGIGPTHDDITADCVAKAFGVALEYHPRAVEIMRARIAATGGVMNEARMRMTRVPAGAELVLNKISGAPGFWIDNVIVMAGIPSVMQAMLEYVTPQLKTGIKDALGIRTRRPARGRYRHRARRNRQKKRRRRDRLLPVRRRKGFRQYQCRGALARSANARRRQSRG